LQKYLKILLSLIFSIILLLGFALPLNPVGNWYQQFLPNINGASIRDITFTDSLNGHCVTSIGGSNSYILKTTNSGDNWVIKFMHTQPFVRVRFINANTGFTNAFTTIYKTTNAGENWSPISLPGIFGDDMFVLSEDTIWLAMSESLTGGVFRTSNGGANWQQQFSGGNQNPNKIYIYNARIGFMSNSSASPNIYKTTNSGENWSVIVNNDRFIDMHFTDSLTGWRTKGDTLRFTSNGGINWIRQLMPYGGMIFSSNLLKFSVLNKDTLWGCGGYMLYPNSQVRAILFRTVNGGANWQFQVPDTVINTNYIYIAFKGKNHGWVYNTSPTGIHTTSGGDPVWYTGITQTGNNVPENFLLYQNYPNPFNPKTIIKYQVLEYSDVKLIVFDVTGKHIIDLTDQKQSAGTYEVDFSGYGYSSGVYFYKLTVTSAKEVFTQTKKMLLIK